MKNYLLISRSTLISLKPYRKICLYILKTTAIHLGKFFLIALVLLKIVLQQRLSLIKALFIKLTASVYTAMPGSPMIFYNVILKFRMEVFTAGKNYFVYRKRSRSSALSRKNRLPI